MLDHSEEEDFSEDYTYLKHRQLVLDSELPLSIDVPPVLPDALDRQQVENVDMLFNLDFVDLQLDGEILFPSSLYDPNKQYRRIIDVSDTQQENEEENCEDTVELPNIIETEPEIPVKPFFKSVKSYLVESGCTKEVCRICFRTILDEEMIKLYEESEDANSIRNMLLLVLPDLDLEVYPNAVVCIKCKELVEYSFQLKELWLTTEEKLQKIIEKKKGEIKCDADLVIVAKNASTTIDKRVIKDIITCKSKNVTQVAEENLRIQSVEDTSNNVNLNTGGIMREKLVKKRSEYRYRRRKKTIWGVGPYLCEKCGNILTSLVSFRNHLRRHRLKELQELKPKVQIETKQICEFCGKIFPNAGSLGTHKWVHRVNPFKCTVCEKVFKYKRSLEVHVRQKHLKLCDYQCHICGKQFIYQESLNQHIKLHNPQLRNFCHICNKNFTASPFLKRHMQRHAENIEKFRCKYCGNSIKHKHSLIKHIEIFHKGIGGYNCDLCNKIYWKKMDLMSHRFRVHGFGPDDE